MSPFKNYHQAGREEGFPSEYHSEKELWTLLFIFHLQLMWWWACMAERQTLRRNALPSKKPTDIGTLYWPSPADEDDETWPNIPSRRPVGLVVWFSLRVREVPGSIPGLAPHFLGNSSKTAIRRERKADFHYQWNVLIAWPSPKAGQVLKCRRFFIFWGGSRWWLVGSVHVTFSRHLGEGLHEVLPIVIAEESRMFTRVLSLPQWRCFFF